MFFSFFAALQANLPNYRIKINNFAAAVFLDLFYCFVCLSMISASIIISSSLPLLIVFEDDNDDDDDDDDDDIFDVSVLYVVGL